VCLYHRSQPGAERLRHPERLVTPTGWPATWAGPDLPSSNPMRRAALRRRPHPRGGQSRLAHRPNEPRVRDSSTVSSSAELMDRPRDFARRHRGHLRRQSNWWAAYALWVFTLFGHPDVRLLNGGRDLWMHDGRDTTLDVPSRASSAYPVVERNDAPIRAFKDDVLAVLGSEPLIDVRSPDEYTGKRTTCRLSRGRRVARRPHPIGALDPWGKAADDQRGGSAAETSWRALRVHRARRQNHRLLPHRRAVQPHLVVLTHLLGVPACATTTARGPNG